MRHQEMYRLKRWGMIVGLTCVALAAANTPAASLEDAGLLLAAEAPDLREDVAATVAPSVEPEVVPGEAVEIAQDATTGEAILEAVRSQDEAPADTAVEAEPAQAEIQMSQPDAMGVMPRLVFEEDVRKFLKMLGQAYQKNIVPSPQVRGQVSVDLYDVTYKEALDAVLTVNGFAYEEQGPFLFVYTQREMQEMQAAQRQMESRVFTLNYVPPADVQALILPLLGTNGKVTTSPEAGQGKAEEGDKWAGKSVLIVQAYPEQLDQIAMVIAELDQRPAQVLIEATILVASLDDTNQLGIDLLYDGGVNFEFFDEGELAVSSASGSDGGVTTEFAGNVSSGGLSIGITNNNIGVLIRALESTTDVVTLGNPKILALNRQLGMVHVGNRDGYITTEVSQTTATQTVQFLETGTQLKFRPFVMQDGFIRMELNPKDSDGGVEVQGEFTLPSESTTEVTTNVLVQDGHTIVIGGLFRDRTSISRGQIPGLGNIPGLGALFRSTSDESTREEVIFLITPHIVQEEVDYAMGEETLMGAQELKLAARRGLQWHCRDRLASAHYNWAKQHQAAGNLDKALWDANLATHISPAFLDAQQLRWELVSEEVYRGQYGSMKNFMREMVARSR